MKWVFFWTKWTFWTLHFVLQDKSALVPFSYREPDILQIAVWVFSSQTVPILCIFRFPLVDRSDQSSEWSGSSGRGGPSGLGSRCIPDILQFSISGSISDAGLDIQGSLSSCFSVHHHVDVFYGQFFRLLIAAITGALGNPTSASDKKHRSLGPSKTTVLSSQSLDL